MLYRTNPKNQEKLSILGYGCLRFSKKGTGIDQEKAEEEMRIAVENGVNYFDTAYTYNGSEVCLGKFLAKGYRAQVKIATKLPHYYINQPQDMERYFLQQLERLQTDHVEYYLMHMLNDIAAWKRLKTLGIEEWIAEKKKSGQIENIGFSFHGNTENFKKIVDDYNWDFCQIQYNYMDEHSQAGRRGLEHAYKKGMPVIIMEPLRGGRLVQGLPKSALKIIEKATPKRSPAEWGLKWLFHQPEVTVVLSGMNDPVQVKENLRIAGESEPGCFTEKDLEVIEKVKNEINRYMKVPCTGCGYCMPCPAGVDIPGCFSAYNTSYTDSWYSGIKSYVMCTTLRTNRTNASNCLKCGKCELHCPQQIDIRKELGQVKKRMENPIYQVIKMVSKHIGKY
ncbi:MAG: aldo/keto reductase [Lachnospiraceae bacterium]